MNPQDKIRQIPVPPGKMPLKVPPTIPAAETRFAAQASCESDCGSFILQFAELRPVTPYYVNPVTGETDRWEGNSANVVVARVAISPLTLVHLKRAIEAAEKYHVTHHGPLPDPQKFLSQLITEMPSAPTPERERPVGFRQNKSGKPNT
jgi:hypothetical protein